ncbi:MAG: T9SS type A sorting domain-containing protein [Ignavibacteria bacterium]|nr:T9SS type A sorting domain-containing protein [Ignavibacteria bacterium]
MKKSTSGKFIVNFLLITVSVSFLIYASSTGITGVTLKNGDGCDCHGSLSTSVIVTINGPDVMTVNETASFTVTITGGTLSAGGTNIAASTGTLTAGAGLKKVGDELTHTSPKSPVSNVVTFEFTYTAPATTGNVTLYANGNSVNLNGANTGDMWNFALNKTITVNPVTDVKDINLVTSFNLNQNYPNPFNPSTNISYSLMEGNFVTLKVFDVLGNEVSTLVNSYQAAGIQNIKFDASKLNSGIYFYRIESGNFVSTKKMILNK